MANVSIKEGVGTFGRRMEGSEYARRQIMDGRFSRPIAPSIFIGNTVTSLT
jgi:hypothetical protein